MKQAIIDGVRTAFLATSDLAKSATLTQPAILDDVTELETLGATTSTEIMVASYKLAEVNGTDVQMGDMKALVEAAQVSFTPEMSDQLVVDGHTWTVMNVDDVAGLGAMYILQLRRPA